MRLPRKYHHGYTLDSLGWRRCVQGILVLMVFTVTAEGLQRTWDVCVRTHETRQTEQLRVARLDELNQAISQSENSRRFYQTDAGILAAARRYGYGLPGERRVMFAPPARRDAAER